MMRRYSNVELLRMNIAGCAADVCGAVAVTMYLIVMDRVNAGTICIIARRHHAKVLGDWCAWNVCARNLGIIVTAGRGIMVDHTRYVFGLYAGVRAAAALGRPMTSQSAT